MYPVLELVRLEENESWGTMGILKIQKCIFCATLEPPDLLNEVNISSIPAQQYICKKYSSERFPNTYEITNVPGRSYVLFHAGNSIEDTAGCVVLGQHHGKLGRSDRVVMNSGKTFNNFMALVGKYEVLHLTIREVY